MALKVDRRPNDFKQAGETYRSFEQWERDDLIKNLVDALKVCAPVVQEKMIQNFKNADKEYGHRVEEGLAKAMKEAEGKNKIYVKDEDRVAKGKGHTTDGY